MSTAPNQPTQTIGTVAQWAKKEQIARQVAQQRIDDHGIPFVSPGLIDFDVADSIWQASMNPAKQEAKLARKANGIPKRAVSELGKVQIERQKLLIQKEKLLIQEMQGKLVPLDTVRAYEAAMFAQIRSALLVIGPELRDDLAGMSNPAQIEEIITKRIHQELAKLAAWRPPK